MESARLCGITTIHVSEYKTAVLWDELNEFDTVQYMCIK